jgi:hypothetical protein
LIAHGPRNPFIAQRELELAEEKTNRETAIFGEREDTANGKRVTDSGMKPSSVAALYFSLVFFTIA